MASEFYVPVHRYEMTKKTQEKNLFKTITFQVQAERDKDIWLWLRAMNYGEPSKTIRILLGVVAKAWAASAPDARETLESFVGKRMNAEMHENTEKHTEKHKITLSEQPSGTSQNMQKPIQDTVQALPKNIAAALLEMDKDFG